MAQMTNGRSVRLFLTLLLDGLLGLWLMGPVVVIGAAVVGAVIAWAVGGSLFTGGWIFALVAAVVGALLLLRNTARLFANFRGPGAYLYKTKWGTYLNK